MDAFCANSCKNGFLVGQDEEAELLAELERIKKEREAAAAKRAAEEASAEASRMQTEFIRGNPLIVGKFDKSADFQVICKRWSFGAHFTVSLAAGTGKQARAKIAHLTAGWRLIGLILPTEWC